MLGGGSLQDKERARLCYWDLARCEFGWWDGRVASSAAAAASPVEPRSSPRGRAGPPRAADQLKPHLCRAYTKGHAKPGIQLLHGGGSVSKVYFGLASSIKCRLLRVHSSMTSTYHRAVLLQWLSLRRRSGHPQAHSCSAGQRWERGWGMARARTREGCI